MFSIKNSLATFNRVRDGSKPFRALRERTFSKIHSETIRKRANIVLSVYDQATGPKANKRVSLKVIITLSGPKNIISV